MNSNFTLLKSRLRYIWEYLNCKVFIILPICVENNKVHFSLDNQTKSLKLQTKKYKHREPTPMWMHSRSEPSLTHQIIRERMNQENLKNNLFC